MIKTIYNLTNSSLFLHILLITTAVSIICFIIVNKFISLELRRTEANSLGYISSTIGVIYAVLLGFTILYVMNNYANAKDVVQAEADYVNDFYRSAKLLPPDMRKQMQLGIKDYAQTVATKEWPDMSKGIINDVPGETIIDRMTDTLLSYKSTAQAPQELSYDLIKLLGQLHDVHKKRESMASNAFLDGNMWVGIIITTILLIFTNSLFGMQRWLHAICMVNVAMASSVLIFLSIAIDRPFAGDFSVKPLELKSSIMRMKIK